MGGCNSWGNLRHFQALQSDVGCICRIGKMLLKDSKSKGALLNLHLLPIVMTCSVDIA